MASINPADISIRPATASDDVFLRVVHQAARHWEFESLLHSGQTNLYHTIMAQQFEAQQKTYFAAYPEAHYGVIQWTSQPVGRLYLDYRDDEVRVLDIAILPDYRGHGIGEIVMKGVCIAAGLRNMPVRLHVHYLNRARTFYQALGFRRIGAAGPNLLLEWRHPDPEALTRGQFMPPGNPVVTVNAANTPPAPHALKGPQP